LWREFWCSWATPFSPDYITIAFSIPRLGAAFPRLHEALSAADPATVVHQVQAGQAVQFEVDGAAVALNPEEVLVHTQPAAGLAVATERGVTETHTVDGMAITLGVARQT
jgi:hypothetical protein